MWTRTFTIVLVTLLSASCAGARQDGLRISTNDLSDIIPVVVEGTVLSAGLVPLKDDPFLPPDWESDPQLKEAVSSGVRHRKYQIEVTKWLKGNGPRRLYLVAPTGQPGVYNEAADEIPTLDVEQSYRFWLEPHPFFGDAHFALAWAERS
jgi:hypothetical protein